ncbi:hypothetical protein [Brevibacillus migulae]|uniref:hypothetical protein n=1 Tax=Brevibacillus migulae TaxID=1644114 RepID=UPI00106DDBB3|nr:hypothetical protein [Brevibacillus migulae]
MNPVLVWQVRKKEDVPTKANMVNLVEQTKEGRVIPFPTATDKSGIVQESTVTQWTVEQEQSPSAEPVRITMVSSGFGEAPAKTTAPQASMRLAA